jgi:integrase
MALIYFLKEIGRNDVQVAWDLRWVKSFIEMYGKQPENPEKALKGFLDSLSRRLEEKIVRYAGEAVQRYFLFLQIGNPAVKSELQSGSQEPPNVGAEQNRDPSTGSGISNCLTNDRAEKETGERMRAGKSTTPTESQAEAGIQTSGENESVSRSQATPGPSTLNRSGGGRPVGKSEKPVGADRAGVHRSAECPEQPLVPGTQRRAENTGNGIPVVDLDMKRWLALSRGYLEKTREILKLKHRSYRTEKSYLSWLTRFFRFLEEHRSITRRLGTAAGTGGRLDDRVSPITADDLRAFLAFLAAEGSVSSGTQNQAFNALLLFFRYVLVKDIEGLCSVLRAKRKLRLPVVFTREEVARVFDALRNPYRLMAAMIYGGGLRLEECLSLRVKDLDFTNETLIVRSGKGDKDRLTLLPPVLFGDLKRHLHEIRRIWEEDRRLDAPGVKVPLGLDRKYQGVGKRWEWFWVFPARGFCTDPRTGAGISIHRYYRNGFTRRSSRRGSASRRACTR